MSRKSDNSKTGSEGNGDSIFSSYSNTPRKSPDFVSAGPFGDFCTEKASFPKNYVFTMNNGSSSDVDDQETFDLKNEYFERLNIIRQKLASIDIANYDRYDCQSTKKSSPGCKITEIYEDNLENTESNKNTNIVQRFPIETCADEGTISKKDRLTIRESNEGFYISDEDHKSHVEATQLLFAEENSNVGNVKLVEESCSKIYTVTTDNEKNSDKKEMKTIFKHDNSFNLDDSSLELIDLNYNPPKKKYCIREQTPKIIMSEGAMSLPYHIRIGLHGDVLKIHDKDKVESSGTANLNTKDSGKITSRPADGTNQDREGHIFPKIHVDCFGGGDQETFGRKTFERDNDIEIEGDDCSKTPIRGGNDYGVFFFDTLQESPMESNTSNKTVITETTITSDSPSRKPKRRKVFMRSARNKVKPLDKISLWEEIRTLEVLSRRKQEDSSSSLDSYFKEIIDHTIENSNKVELVSTESQDILSKSKPSSKYLSICKISDLCSLIFRKKSKGLDKDTGVREETSTHSKRSIANKSEKKNKETLETAKAAHMLLIVRKDQDLDIDLDESSTTYQMHSEYSYPDDKDDDYEGFCSLCFCI